MEFMPLMDMVIERGEREGKKWSKKNSDPSSWEITVNSTSTHTHWKAFTLTSASFKDEKEYQQEASKSIPSLHSLSLFCCCWFTLDVDVFIYQFGVVTSFAFFWCLFVCCTSFWTHQAKDTHVISLLAFSSAFWTRNFSLDVFMWNSPVNLIHLQKDDFMTKWKVWIQESQQAWERESLCSIFVSIHFVVLFGYVKKTISCW